MSTLCLEIHCCTRRCTPSMGGGGGGMERDQISDIRSPNNQISYIRPPKKSDITRSQKSDIRSPKKINYQISHPLKNQISDIKVPPFHPPPPSMSGGKTIVLERCVCVICTFGCQSSNTKYIIKLWCVCALSSSIFCDFDY